VFSEQHKKIIECQNKLIFFSSHKIFLPTWKDLIHSISTKDEKVIESCILVNLSIVIKKTS